MTRMRNIHCKLLELGPLCSLILMMIRQSPSDLRLHPFTGPHIGGLELIHCCVSDLASPIPCLEGMFHAKFGRTKSLPVPTILFFCMTGGVLRAPMLKEHSIISLRDHSCCQRDLTFDGVGFTSIRFQRTYSSFRATGECSSNRREPVAPLLTLCIT